MSGRLVLGVTDAVTADAFLRGHIAMARARGMQVSLLASPSELLDRVCAETGATPMPVEMHRSISPLADLKALSRAFAAFRRRSPDVVHCGTPKAGLIAGIAALMNRVPRRVYTLHGLRFEGESGARRVLLMLIERISCRVATDVVAVSPSVMAVAVNAGIVRSDKVRVLGSGSIAGVSPQRLLGPPSAKLAKALSGIPKDAKVVTFVGRLTRDKGIQELISAWPAVQECDPNAHLIVAGEEDPADMSLDLTQLKNSSNSGNVHWVGTVDRVGSLLSRADLLVLPSYREGMPTVVLEAASLAVPSLVSRVTGCVDAVEHGITGWVVDTVSPEALSTSISDALKSDDLVQLGVNAQHMVRAKFDPQIVHESYFELLFPGGGA